MENIPFFLPNISEGEIEEIAHVLTHAEENSIASLEEEFRSYIGAKHAISTSNGASAMHLCLCALDLKRGDKIICSVNCHPFIPEAIRYFDAEPIFVDVNEDNFNALPERCEEILENNSSKKLRGIVVSHIGGALADVDRFYELGKKYKIKIIEDATEAMGLAHKSKKVGSLKADASIFSFFPERPHNIANAGMMVTNDDALAKRAFLLRYHALVHERAGSERPEYLYDVFDIGNRYDISQIDATCALIRLRKQEAILKRHKEIARIYDRELKSLQHLTIPARVGSHIFSAYIIKIDKNRDGFARELMARGIHTDLHYIPLHILSYYKNKYRFKINDFPNALRNFQQVLSLPIYSKLSNSEVRYICEQVKLVDKGRV
ncbi:MAG: DegT/DnrJ/EryC1/StrS family aminotransferase [Wolinella sp.]